MDADALLNQIQNKKFLFLLVTFNLLFEVSDYATKGLQSPTLSVTDCTDLIEGLKDNYTKFRHKNATYNKTLALADDLMIKHDINWDIGASRKRKLPARLEDSLVGSTLGKSFTVQTNSDLRRLWNDTLDRQITELNIRFKPDTYGFMKATAACLPRTDTFGDIETIHPVCTHFSIHLNGAEHTVFVQHIQRKMNETGDKFPTLIEVLDSCPRDIFPMNSLLRALLTLPMTTCTVERLFSTVNRIKTSTRATMLTERLNSLSLLSFERELTENIDYKDILAVFNQKSRRLLL
ncbi:unnamed protein product [Knipowitschia caucasica]